MEPEKRQELTKQLRKLDIVVPRGMSDYVFSIFAVENGVAEWN